MPADEPTEGEIEINGKKYKANFKKFEIQNESQNSFGPDGSFAFEGQEHLTVECTGFLEGGAGYDEPGDYRDRLHNPPQN